MIFKFKKQNIKNKSRITHHNISSSTFHRTSARFSCPLHSRLHLHRLHSVTRKWCFWKLCSESSKILLRWVAFCCWCGGSSTTFLLDRLNLLNTYIQWWRNCWSFDCRLLHCILRKWRLGSRREGSSRCSSAKRNHPWRLQLQGRFRSTDSRWCCRFQCDHCFNHLQKFLPILASYHFQSHSNKNWQSHICKTLLPGSCWLMG